MLTRLYASSLSLSRMVDYYFYDDEDVNTHTLSLFNNNSLRTQKTQLLFFIHYSFLLCLNVFERLNSLQSHQRILFDFPRVLRSHVRRRLSRGLFYDDANVFFKTNLLVTKSNPFVISRKKKDRVKYVYVK